MKACLCPKKAEPVSECPLHGLRQESLPSDWPSLTLDELQRVAKFGTYGQRLIANRYLADWSKDHPPTR